jgi:hypothetical protein
MTLSLTCACGVHLEVDETFAGQTITCPDCQRPLRVPAPDQAPLRTSGLAITSLILALVGAFTLLGTLLAVLLGALALAQINRRRDRLAGKGFAVAGIVLGLVLTGLGLFAYSPVELFGVDHLLRESQWAGKLDYDGPLEVVRASDGYAITRPSKQWGLRHESKSAETFPRLDAPPRGLLLINVAEGGYIACVPVAVPDNATLEDCRKRAELEFARLDFGAGGRQAFGLRSDVKVEATHTLEPQGETERVEMTITQRTRGQEKTFLVRVVKKPQDGTLYLVAGGGRTDHFARLEPEVRQALDSFRLLPRDRPRDWQPNW